MEKMRALRFLFSILETAYNKRKDFFGPAFCRDFIASYASIYSDLTRQQYLKAAAVIDNFRLRNKMINLMDVISHSEPLQPQKFTNGIIPIEIALMQFVWVLQRFKENNKTVTESILRRGKEILAEEEYHMLIHLVNMPLS